VSIARVYAPVGPPPLGRAMQTRLLIGAGRISYETRV
jgi:hypothetical protein